VTGRLANHVKHFGVAFSEGQQYWHPLAEVNRLGWNIVGYRRRIAIEYQGNVPDEETQSPYIIPNHPLRYFIYYLAHKSYDANVAIALQEHKCAP